MESALLLYSSRYLRISKFSILLLDSVVTLISRIERTSRAELKAQIDSLTKEQMACYSENRNRVEQILTNYGIQRMLANTEVSLEPVRTKLPNNRKKR